jgi:TRAP transporter TAXI family solute receptor
MGRIRKENFMRLFWLVFIVLPLSVLPVQADEIVIGTGSKSGVYFQVGRSICRLLDRNAEDLSCQPVETAGSVANLTNVENGSLEIGIVQSDIQHHAVHRSGPYRFVDVPHDNLRALFSLYVEPFNLVARRDAGISGLDDLKGLRINIGNIGSGHRETMEVVMRAKGWGRKDFQLVTELPASEQTMALCHGQVHAMVYTAGHPNRSIGNAIELCDATLIEVSGAEIDRLVSENPFYAYTSIPIGVYPGVDEPVKTFGTLATVMSSADIDDALIYTVVKTIFENLDRFKRTHMAFHDLNPEAMVSQGLAAPLHEGAERYYREVGWID